MLEFVYYYKTSKTFNITLYTWHCFKTIGGNSKKLNYIRFNTFLGRKRFQNPTRG